MLRQPATKYYLVALLAAVTMSCSSVCAQAVPSASQSKQHDEFLVLDNGRVMQGQVTRTADQVHVRTESGSRIILPAERVKQIFGSLADVWDYRASTLDADDIEGHLSLFHWCLKHRLKAESQHQLNRLRESEIGERRLKYLDRKLVATFSPPKPKVVANIDTSEAEKSRDYHDVAEVFQSLPVAEEDPEPVPDVIIDRAIALASHSEPGNRPSKAKAQSASAQSSSTASGSRTSVRKKMDSQTLDSMTKLLNRDDLHQFQRRVQPVLLKGCLAAKCHNSTAAVMPLFHRGRGQLVPKRFTQRNLQSIVEWVDSSQPADSSLLAQAVTAHGGQKSPGVNVGSKEFDLLNDWLHSAARNSSEFFPAVVVPKNAAPIGLASLDSDGAEATSETKKTGRGTTDPSKKRQTAKPERKRPEPVVDPFDPTAFNRLPK